MTPKLPYSIASLTLAVLVLAIALAMAQSPSLADRFDRLDRNHDGKLTPDELPQAAFFKRLDRNVDGVVEKSELPGGSRSPSSSRKGAPEIKVTEELDLAYGKHERQRLDLYRSAAAKDAPVMVYIHGGGWRRGDKRGVGEKVGFFAGRGWVLVSVNYRLLPEGRHPANVNDVALALAWVHDHAREYGGDPEKMFVMGHSAGAHLAALVATSKSPLQETGKGRIILKGVISLDTNTYDIPKLMESGRGFYGEVFGDDPDLWKDASPITHVGRDVGIPPFLICYSRGMRERMNPQRPAQANAFAKALREAGIEAKVVDASDRNHGEINQWFGRADDEKVTGAAVDFLDGILGIESSVQSSRPAAPAERPAAPSPLGEHHALVRFTRSYVPGTRDVNGQFMGGTETMRLVAHHGKLFAGLSYWTDQRGEDPRPGAQVLVKRGPHSPWEVSQNFRDSLRISAMESFTFTTDHRGTKLDAAVSLLVADAGLVRARDEGPLRCLVLNDATGEWEESLIRPDVRRAFVRAVGFHHDAVSGVDHLFAGTGAGEIYRGSYDPESPARIRWQPEPEYVNPDFDGGAFKRCQGLCVANGKLYASVAPRLLERRDGVKPEWVEVFRWNPQERAGAGLRGITAVPALDGDHEIILGSREQEGRILRVDPENDYRVELELDSHVFLRQRLGEFRGGKLVAYNRFVPGAHPATGERIHWVSVAGMKPGDLNAAWLLIRHAGATYEPVRVFDPNLDDPPVLISTRTLEFAPWSDREFYTGGYDGAANNRRNHNSAWIYKGTLLRQGEQP